MEQGEGYGRKCYGFVGNVARTCGWFFTYKNECPKVESEEEVEAVISTLEKDETCSHHPAIPYRWVVQLLREELNEKLSYFEDRQGA